jgi:hypothetical protein
VFYITTAKIFFKVAVAFAFSPAMCESSSYSLFLSKLNTVTLFDFSYSSGSMGISDAVLMYISPGLMILRIFS